MAPRWYANYAAFLGCGQVTNAGFPAGKMAVMVVQPDAIKEQTTPTSATAVRSDQFFVLSRDLLMLVILSSALPLTSRLATLSIQ